MSRMSEDETWQIVSFVVMFIIVIVLTHMDILPWRV